MIQSNIISGGKSLPPVQAPMAKPVAKPAEMPRSNMPKLSPLKQHKSDQEMLQKKESEPKTQTINLNSLNTRSNQSAGDGTEKQINSETDPVSSQEHVVQVVQLPSEEAEEDDDDLEGGTGTNQAASPGISDVLDRTPDQ